MSMKREEYNSEKRIEDILEKYENDRRYELNDSVINYFTSEFDLIISTPKIVIRMVNFVWGILNDWTQLVLNASHIKGINIIKFVTEFSVLYDNYEKMKNFLIIFLQKLMLSMMEFHKIGKFIMRDMCCAAISEVFENYPDILNHIYQQIPIEVLLSLDNENIKYALNNEEIFKTWFDWIKEKNFKAENILVLYVIEENLKLKNLYKEFEKREEIKDKDNTKFKLIKSIDNLYAKMIDPITFFNIYGKAKLLTFLEKSPFKNMCLSLIISSVKDLIIIDGLLNIFTAFKFYLEYSTSLDSQFLIDLIIRIVFDINSINNHKLERLCLNNFVKLLKTKNLITQNDKSAFPLIEILPYEYSSIKLDKIYTSTYLNAELLLQKDMPLKIINIFQNYKHFTQFSKISRMSYSICEYLLQTFSYKHVVQDVLTEIKDVLQIKPKFIQNTNSLLRSLYNKFRSEKQEIKVLEKISNKDGNIVDSNDEENFWKPSKIFKFYLDELIDYLRLREPPIFLKEYLKLLEYLIMNMNFLTHKASIFLTIKKLISCVDIQAVSEENHIIGLNILHLINKIVTSKRLEHDESYLDRSMEILEYMRDSNHNICLRDDCELMILIIKKLKMMDIKDFLYSIPQESLVVPVEEKFEKIPFYGKDILGDHFNIRKSKKERYEIGIRDGGSVFYFHHIEKTESFQIKKRNMKDNEMKSLEELCKGINLNDVILDEDIDDIMNSSIKKKENICYNDLNYLLKKNFNLINPGNPEIRNIKYELVSTDNAILADIESKANELAQELAQYCENYLTEISSGNFEVGLVLYLDVNFAKSSLELPENIHSINIYLARSRCIITQEDMCIPYISKNIVNEKNKENTKIFLRLLLNECKPGKADIGISFFDFLGKFYAGICGDVEIEFKDFFFPMKMHSLISSNTIKSKVVEKIKELIPIEGFKLEEKLNIYLYFYLLSKHCKELSVRVIKRAKKTVLRLENDYLGYFNVHRPYIVKDSDPIKLLKKRIWKDIDEDVAKSTYDIGKEHTDKTKIVSRSIILLPKTIYLLFRIEIFEARTIITIRSNNIDIFQYLDEYFDEWKQHQPIHMYNRNC